MTNWLPPGFIAAAASVAADGGCSAKRTVICSSSRVKLTVCVGGVIGVVGAYYLGRTATALLFELKPYDPVVVGLSVLLLTIVAFGAGYIPAYRASRVHPMEALRYE